MKTTKSSSRPAKGKKKGGQSTVSLRSAVMHQFGSDADDDEVLLSGGTILGHRFGRCGGRLLCSELERTICDLLSSAGLTHSHSPRHFEVPVTDAAVAAYAPLIVLRGRGRGGKTVVIECAVEVEPSILHKIVAFRKEFGSEFYVIFIAPEELIDLIPLAAYDESSVTTDLGTLINRLAD